MEEPEDSEVVTEEPETKEEEGKEEVKEAADSSDTTEGKEEEANSEGEVEETNEEVVTCQVVLNPVYGNCYNFYLVDPSIGDAVFLLLLLLFFPILH